jgi:hypothetical protein
VADTKSVLTWLLRDQVSGPAKSIEGALGKAETKAKGTSGIMAKLGQATGGLVNPLSLALGGVVGLVGGLSFAAKAAADEEKNIAKMTTALKASVPGFDGNTEAIEALIAKREDLAFSDDELRDSLATLVTSTHDVNAATDLQATAMDLARLKGVDLATASEALAKANAGSTRELKALGIVVDDSKDKTQVFAAIQKAAAGQAAAYASTTNAKWTTLQNKFGDLVETVGGALLPVLDGLASFAIDTLIPAIAGVVDVIVGIAKAIRGAIQAVKDFIAQFQLMKQYTAEEKAAHFGISPHAAGGTLDPGWNLVGEQGPELISPSRQVYGAGQTAGMLGAASGAPVVIALQLDGREVARVVDKHLYYRLLRAGTGS